MSETNFYETLLSVLRTDKRFLSDGGMFLRNAVYEAAMKMDENLIKLLLSNKDTCSRFFTDVAGIKVFDKMLFAWIINNRQFLPDSYTRFKNKIGLTDEKGELISSSGNVELVFPYKDCVLEGGQTKEDQKRDEIFYNETLAPDEIDRLLYPKVLVNAKRYTNNGAEDAVEFRDDDNLIVRGNNLLALSSLLKNKKVCGNVKCIYIDPPYFFSKKKEEDTFKYNSNFKLSSWLVFMKNRLEIAKKLLSDDGAIFVQISDDGVGELHCLLKDIFKPENFINKITVKTKSPSGFASVNPGVFETAEYILAFAKNKPKWKYNIQYVESGYDENYKFVVVNRKDPLEAWIIKNIVDVLAEEQGYRDAKEMRKQLGKHVVNEMIAKYALEHADSVFQSVAIGDNAGQNVVAMREESKRDPENVFVVPREGQYTVYIRNGREVAFYSKKLHEVDGKFVPSMQVSNIWMDTPYEGIAGEGSVTLNGGKKPEKLIRRILEMATNPGDLVLDYHLGSGTTCAVAHKIGRKYIGIEQLDYGENDSTVRLDSVIKGDTTGISKAVKWQGGGSFVYCELAKQNQTIVEEIEAAKDKASLSTIYKKMIQSGFISRKVNPKEITSAAEKFSDLSFGDQKTFLMEILDKNLLYVNYCDIDDTEFAISGGGQGFHEKFLRRTVTMAFLYEKIDFLREQGYSASLPEYIPRNLNSKLELRPYQKEAFENFITHYESTNRPNPLQVLFHMATGSGKTLIMAGLMLYLYKQGYRNFLFFVNLSNIVEKTKENFCNPTASKYLFADEIVIEGERIRINQVENFQHAEPGAINIRFATTQGLHMDMWFPKENGMTFDDFDNQKVVLISDEAHHLNVETKSKKKKDEEEDYRTWEQTVKNIFGRNADNILLEFTATCDLDNKSIRASYENKIVFDYTLTKFYNDKYSKDILTLRSDLSRINRALLALVLSQYRLKIFQKNRLAVKPVVLFKAAKIADSKEFMEVFLNAVKNLSGSQLQKLSIECDNEAMQKAFSFFTSNGISFDALAAEIRDDFSEGHCVSVNDDKDATQKQILLNTLEDADNPYRAIFEVKKLDEGWDVLNLFDIVRLYETRQSGKNKVSEATIAEAQLIGRGARYCPFRVNEDQSKFQRKYDEDMTNELRVCETLYYHCQNDHRYVSELKNALREIGLNSDEIVQQEYVLKESFKTDDLYTHGLIFLNEKIVKDRNDVRCLSPKVRDDIYCFQASSGMSGIDAVMTESSQSETIVELKTTHTTIKDIANINYAIVNKALMKYPILKFNTLHSYFPNLTSTRQFITDDEYLGKVRIDIQSKEDEPTVETLYSAVFYVLGKIANSISDIQERYSGTKEFKAKNVRDVFRNKTVNYTKPHDGGVGVSQNDSSVKKEWKIDLSNEDWFAYTDNFGTSEEKAFVAYFKGYVDDLRKTYSKVYLVRNEREFHIYSFDDGERFEPDYVLFLQKDKMDGFEQIQIFIEPKGTQLLESDAWKEKFMLQLIDEAVPVKMFVDDNDYRIWGFHFFNLENRMSEFDTEFQAMIQ